MKVSTMTLSLYSTLRAWRRDIQSERMAVGERAESPVYAVIARLGTGLAGISCGGDIAPSERY